MKYLEHNKEILQFIREMIADIDDDYGWITSVNEITEVTGNLKGIESKDNVKFMIKIESNPYKNYGDRPSGYYINLQVIKDKMEQVIDQIPEFKIDSMFLRFEKSKYSTGSYFLSDNLTYKKKEIARQQGYTSSDELKNIGKYIKPYDLVQVVLVQKEKNNKIKRFFQFFN